MAGERRARESLVTPSGRWAVEKSLSAEIHLTKSIGTTVPNELCTLCKSFLTSRDVNKLFHFCFFRKWSSCDVIKGKGASPTPPKIGASSRMPHDLTEAWFLPLSQHVEGPTVGFFKQRAKYFWGRRDTAALLFLSSKRRPTDSVRHIQFYFFFFFTF